MSKMRAVRFTPRAEHELAGAFKWYDLRRSGLGEEFLEEISEAVALLRRSPDIGTCVAGVVRRYLLRRFPYGVFYGVDDGTVVIVAVIHAHRDPRHWPTAFEHAPGR